MIAYFDCFSGVSGDMTLGALLACGAGDAKFEAEFEADFRRQMTGLRVPGYTLKIERVVKQGITATDVDVVLLENEQGHGRHLSDIAALFDHSTLPEAVRRRALAVFTRLADAEAKIHGTTREEIHFHEVGAVDAIVDIAGSCLLLEMLGVSRVFLSSIPCGHGTITCAHGVMPVPAPATLELLAGFPVHSVDVRGELVTPTGAALLTTLADPQAAGRMPPMRVFASGYGAGKKQFQTEMPNLLRVVIGEALEAQTTETADKTPQTIAVLETNLDDHNPESLELVMERAFAAGALDVFFAPIQMKKNRPALLVTVLCPTAKVEEMAGLLFRETGTFGVRIREQRRLTLARTWRTVSTPYGDIRLKLGAWQGEEVSASPEYDDCKRAAQEHDVPLRRVYDAVRRLA